MYAYIPAKDVARARQFYEQKLGLKPKQEIAGGVVPTTITVWLHVEALLQESVAFQVRVAAKVLPQSALVVVPVMVMVTTWAVPSRVVAVNVSVMV